MLKKIYSLMILALSLSGCGKEAIKPKLQISTGKILIISGKIPEKTKVDIAIVYETTNEKCKVVSNWFTQFLYDQKYIQKLNVDLKSGNYFSQISLAQPQSDKCEWRLSFIQFIFKKNQEELSYTINFVKPTQKKTVVVDIVCEFLEVPGATPLLQCDGDGVGELPVDANELLVNFAIKK